MTTPPEKPSLHGSTVGLIALGAETAPFIYCDGVMTCGAKNGMIQIELAADILTLGPEAVVRNDVIITGHLRCSPRAAVLLRNSIDKALQMLADSSSQSASAATPGPLNYAGLLLLGRARGDHRKRQTNI